MTTESNPKIIPLFKKQTFLDQFSEDDFRDRVVRPLYELKGLKHAKDVCGPDEDGKDCYFWGFDTIRGRVLYAVQTKKGNIKMAASARDNLLNAVAQLRTALSTSVKDSTTKSVVLPDYVILIASGEINKRAQEHIVDEIKDPRLLFRDRDNLVVDIDEVMPEFWLGIDVQRLPYLRALREYLVNSNDAIDLTRIGISHALTAPVTSDTFAQLYLNRVSTKNIRGKWGKPEKELDFEEFPIQDILKHRERVSLISGGPGCGKTTTLHRLAMVLVEQALESSEAPHIPVLLTARELGKDLNVIDAANAVIKRFTNGGASGFERTDLVDGRVVILVDGFDELAHHDLQNVVIKRLAAFLEEFSKTRLIVTSRDSDHVREVLNKISFARFTISPINLRQARRMVDRLASGKTLTAAASEELLRRLDSIHGIELNPLLVTVFVATTDYARTDIPANITELFKKFTELMLGRWDQSKGLAQQYQSQVKDFLLCKIAFTMHERGTTSLPFTEFSVIVGEELNVRGLDADVKVLFDEIVNRSGLLRIEGDSVVFRHLLLQEFFAGRGIPSADYLMTIVSKSWWQRPIVFYFGDRPNDFAALSVLEGALSRHEGTDLFQAACTLGLVVQASYWTRTDEKMMAMCSVIEAMGRVKHQCIEHFGKAQGTADVLRFVMYYLYGRDSVAAKIIPDVADEIFKESYDRRCNDEELETRRFWVIAGLIESGSLDLAEALAKEFRPKDDRLLLALQIGCFYVEKMHVTENRDKRKAKRFGDKLLERVQYLRKAVLEEMKGSLLEIHQGEVKYLDQSSDVSHDISGDKSDKIVLE